MLRDGDKPAPAPAAAAAAAAAADNGDESSDDGMYITDDDRKITARQEAAYAGALTLEGQGELSGD